MQPPREGRPLRVVVVEDNDDGREMLRLTLETAGYHVVAAADGLTGLDLILMLEPDVALVEIGLPKLDGYEVARRLTAANRFHRTRLIALSAYDRPEDKWKSYEAGFDDHLVKPIAPPVLEHTMATLLAIGEPG
jgi:CheY-like chemotaxis protein